MRERILRNTKTLMRATRVLTFFLCLAICFSVVGLKVQAKDLDEILNYTITISVNDDATLHMVYHIDWKVLDSTSEGPLEWVQVGAPNPKYKAYDKLSDTIRKIKYESSSGCYRIDLDRKYKKDEVVSFEFYIDQDYLYQVNKDKEGETVYEFTPGWFDDIKVDNLQIMWKNDKMLSWSPSCEVIDGYNTWTKSLKKGEKFQVSAVYPNDAFKFDMSKTIKVKENDDDDDVFFGCCCLTFVGIFIASEKEQNSAHLYCVKAVILFPSDRAKRIFVPPISAIKNCTIFKTTDETDSRDY